MKFLFEFAFILSICKFRTIGYYIIYLPNSIRLGFLRISNSGTASLLNEG
jgi:hypothetical protein